MASIAMENNNSDLALIASVLKVWAVNLATFLVTLTNIELYLKLTLLVLSIGWTSYKFYHDIKEKKKLNAKQ